MQKKNICILFGYSLLYLVFLCESVFFSHIHISSALCVHRSLLLSSWHKCSHANILTHSHSFFLLFTFNCNAIILNSKSVWRNIAFKSWEIFYVSSQFHQAAFILISWMQLLKFVDFAPETFCKTAELFFRTVAPPWSLMPRTMSRFPLLVFVYLS